MISLLVCSLACPVEGRTQVQVELENPKFAEGDFDLLGRDLDLEGDFLLVSAPLVKELHFYTRAPGSGTWSSGITIALTTAFAVGAPVALGDDLAIYYALQPSSNGDVELRERRLGISTTDSLVASIPESWDVGLPDSLAVTGDLMIAGWRGKPGRGAGWLAWERFPNGWSSVGGLIVSEEVSEVRAPGFDVDTDGERLVATDPKSGDHGSFTILSKGPTRSWISEEVFYTNPLQGNVFFGSSVSVERDCIAVGMLHYNSGSIIVPGSVVADTGGVQLFAPDYPFGGWVPTAALVPSGALQGDEFGTEVILHGPNLLIAGENAQRTNATTPGDVSFWQRTGSCLAGQWQEVARLRSFPLVLNPTANGAFGGAVGMSGRSGAVVFDYLGPTGELHGRGYVYDVVSAIFTDDFESGLWSWSASSP